MKSVLAIVFLCSVGAAYGDDYFETMEGKPPRIAEIYPLNATHVHRQTRSIANLFGRNERLINVVSSVVKNLAFTAGDLLTKGPFSLVSSFVLNLLNGESGGGGGGSGGGGLFGGGGLLGGLFSTVKNVFSSLFHLGPKQPHVLAAPVRSLLGKFASAISNRMGHIQDLCKQGQDCGQAVSERDAKEAEKCPTYHHHAYVHNMALNKVDSAEKLLGFMMHLVPGIKNALIGAAPLKFEDLKKVIEDCKQVFRVLKSHTYSCYNVHGVSDYAHRGEVPSDS